MKNRIKLTLAGVAQWAEHQPANQKAAVRFPVRAQAWVVSQVLNLGSVRGNQSMFLFLPKFPSLYK